jgi:predicted transglutaminase-like cysteine proteinase
MLFICKPLCISAYVKHVLILLTACLAVMKESYAQPNFDDASFSNTASWQVLLTNAQGLTEQEKVFKVNHFFNQIPFATDDQNWGKADYWASPIEMLNKQAGDCEDYAIAKYTSLLKLGVSAQKLKLAYVHLNGNGGVQSQNNATAAGRYLTTAQSHMVLLYLKEDGAVPVVLDNVIAPILGINQRHDLSPVYAFNDEGMWLYNGWQAYRTLALAMRPAHWLALKERMYETHTFYKNYH